MSAAELECPLTPPVGGPLGQGQNRVMPRMVHATDSRVQWEIQAGSPTFHHQKPFPLFDATSAAHLH